MQRKARVAGAALIAGAFLGACTYTPSNVAADADVSVGGTVLRQDGRPAPGARVALRKHGDAGEALTAVLSVGLACLTEEFGDICRSARVKTSGDDGRFAYKLKGSDTHGSIGNAATMELSTSLPRRDDEQEGPGSSLTFLVQQTKVNMRIHTWEPKVSATADKRIVRLEWSDVPPRLIPEVDPNRLSSRVRFERRGQLVWEFLDLDPGAEIDPRLLEDSRGSFSVSMEGSGFKVSSDAGTELGVTVRSARFPYRSTAGKPASRNAACWVTAGGKRYDQPSCALTDGDFAEDFKPLTVEPCPSTGCPAVDHAYVDLGRVVPVSLVAVRGCASQCTAAISTDARTWRSIGRSSTSDAAPAKRANHAFTLNRGMPARYVRVATGRGIDQMSEVSVWDRAAPLTVAPAPFVAPVENAELPQRERTASSKVPLIAAILGGLAFGALGMALTRRRRTA